MITGSWGDITLVCGNTHDEPAEMVLQEGPASIFYACPKYHRENRSDGERACNNRLNPHVHLLGTTINETALPIGY